MITDTQDLKFRIGDVVRLASGSPAMTVQCVQIEAITTCWFHDGELRSGDFLPEILRSNSERIASNTVATRG